MSYKTNQLDQNILFSSENYENIAQNFWIYQFTIKDISKVGYDYSLIDEIKQELIGVKSVVYLKDKIFYALFEKVAFKNEFELEDHIQKLITNSDEVRFENITNLQNNNLISRRYLAQLLFNSLANTSSKNAVNITGGLYWVIKKDNNQYITLKLELDNHLHLQLKVQTFSLIGKVSFSNRKKLLKDYPKYEILSDNIRTMRRLNKNEFDKTKNVYIQAGIDGKRNTIPFLDFSNWDKFEKSKSGILYLFLKEAKKYLNKYINIQFVSLPSAKKIEFNTQLANEVNQRIQTFYRNKSIVINIAKSLESDGRAKELANKLKNILTNPNKDYQIPDANICIGDLKEDTLNIRIIHNKEFYEKNKITDDYIKDSKYLINHITIEDSKITEEAAKSPVVDVVLKESYIKNDTKHRKITILDWDFGEWIFMGKTEIQTPHQTGKDKRYYYHLLKIAKDGSLTFDKCLSDEVFASESKRKEYIDIYKKYDEYNNKKGFLNCLLVSNHQGINLVYETPLFTIQEIEHIGKMLELEDQPTELLTTKILEMINAFQDNQNFKEDNKLLKVIEELRVFRKQITKKELHDIFDKQGLNNRTKIKNHFCDFYRENAEYFLGQKDNLKSFFRSEKYKEGLLGSRLDIYYYEKNDREADYFVGEKSNGLRSSFQNKISIRRIEAILNLNGEQSPLIFEQLLQTMAVDFVKHGYLTILPFPFKYLREIKLQNDPCNP